MDELLARARDALAAARSTVVLTGAGISAESGIPTFRDAMTGLWSRYRAEDLATPEAFRRDPRTVWDCSTRRWRRSPARRFLPEGSTPSRTSPRIRTTPPVECWSRTGSAGASLLLPGIVPELSATPGRTRWIGPRPGEHTDEVLGSLGLDAAQIAELRSRGAAA